METNRYAQELKLKVTNLVYTRIKRWFDITHNELKMLLVIFLWTDIVQLPQVRDFGLATTYILIK